MGASPLSQQGNKYYTHYTQDHPITLAIYPDSHILIQIQLNSAQQSHIIQQLVNIRKNLNTYSSPFFITAAFVEFAEFHSNSHCFYCLKNKKNTKNQVIKIGYRLIDDESLANIIKVKQKGRNQYFTIQKLYTIFGELISLLAYFQQKKILHGNIHTSTIFFLGNRPLKLAVLDSFFIHEGLTNYQLSIKEPEKQYFLSEEQLKSLKNRKTDFKYIHLDDMFSMGMVFLELSTLQSSSDLYNLRHFKIDKELLKNRLSKIEKMYNSNIAQMISMLLEGNPLKDIQIILNEKKTKKTII